jgi:hypothetical protein
MESPMTAARRPSFLRHFGRGAQARLVPDLADMGTAFALDEALEMGVVPVAPWRLWLGRKLGA